MKVPESRLSFFQFPELINKNLQSKLNEAGEQSVEFHVKLGNFTFMVSTYPTSYHSLLDVKENTELIKVIEAYRTLLTALGKDPKTECARVHNLNLFNSFQNSPFLFCFSNIFNLILSLNVTPT